MKYSLTINAWRDRETGVCYTKAYAFRPLALLAPGTLQTSKVIVLEPYLEHPASEWHARAEEPLTLDYPVFCAGQSIVVTEEVLTQRFEALEPFIRQVDMEAELAEYTRDHCDFTDKKWMARVLEQWLQRQSPALHECIIYTIIKPLRQQGAA